MILSYSNPMQTAGFEQALTSRVDDMLDACTKCGKCFEACPIAAPAGLGGADEGRRLGVLDILRFGKGRADSETMGQGLHGRAASASRLATTVSTRGFS